ncbi:hypothetical protein ATO13_08526 [Stappia sp. 22II-S9-Z10]|nr:hypothetical protein ATO13_08526 [Stappia sp. 22II-S9-Z10]
MTVETPADRRAMLADFGETVTYRLAGGGDAVPIVGLVSAAFVEMSEYSGTGVAARVTTIKVDDADLPDGARQFDGVVRADGTAYRVTEAHPDGTGYTVLLLERAD